MEQFETDPAAVLAALVDRAQREPLLAAWIEAAQWQVAALTERHTNTDVPDTPKMGEVSVFDADYDVTSHTAVLDPDVQSTPT